MALLKWTKKYSVRVKALDDQHKNQIKMLNELHAAMLKGHAQDIASPLFQNLMNFKREHFSAEERLMESTKYPGLAEHRAEHQDLAVKLEEFVARYEQGDQTMYPQLLHFLGNWLHEHMLTVDKQYTAWMNNHGVY